MSVNPTPRQILPAGSDVTPAMREWMDSVRAEIAALAAQIAALPTSMIASVQSGTITIGTGATSNTATITSVNTAKSVVHFLGFTTTWTTTYRGDRTFPRVALTNATTVTAFRDSSDATFTVTVGYCVVEYV